MTKVTIETAADLPNIVITTRDRSRVEKMEAITPSSTGILTHEFEGSEIYSWVLCGHLHPERTLEYCESILPYVTNGRKKAGLQDAVAILRAFLDTNDRPAH